MEHFLWSWMEGKEDRWIDTIYLLIVVLMLGHKIFVEVILTNSGYAHSSLIEGTF
jgi:hypothetical protein